MRLSRLTSRSRRATISPLAHESLAPEVLAASREANLIDLRLYAYARQLFSRKRRQQGLLFQARTRLLPLENRLRRRYWAMRRVSLCQIIKARWGSHG